MALNVRHLVVASVSVALSGARVEAQVGFEGVATFVTRDKQNHKADTIQQISKGRSMRMDGLNRSGKKGGGMIIDGEKKRFIVIDDAGKTAMIMSQDDQEKMRAMSAGITKNMPKTRPPATTMPERGMDITKTGRTETVAGVRCDVYHGVSTGKADKSEGDICVADGVGFGMFSALASNPMFPQSRSKLFDQFRKILGDGKGVIKATTIEGGSSYVALELIKLEKKKVVDSEFEPPVGYQVRSMGDMMNGATDAMEKMRKARSGKPPV